VKAMVAPGTRRRASRCGPASFLGTVVCGIFGCPSSPPMIRSLPTRLVVHPPGLVWFSVSVGLVMETHAIPSGFACKFPPPLTSGKCDPCWLLSELASQPPARARREPARPSPLQTQFVVLPASRSSPAPLVVRVQLCVRPPATPPG